jgi:hypothetical protein
MRYDRLVGRFGVEFQGKVWLRWWQWGVCLMRKGETEREGRLADEGSHRRGGKGGFLIVIMYHTYCSRNGEGY